MIRREQREKQAWRRAERSTFEQLDSPRGHYRPPDRSDCHLKQWALTQNDTDTIALQYMLWRYNGRLVDFVVNVQTLESNGWKSVERFDCCHGHCHHHPHNDDLHVRIIRTLDTIDDVAKAFDEVRQLAHQRVRIIRERQGG